MTIPTPPAPADAEPPPRANGHPDCIHCRGKSLFWRGEAGQARLCEICRSYCECYHGEPFESDFADQWE